MGACQGATGRHNTHRSEFADGDESGIGPILDEQGSLVRAAHPHTHGLLVLAQLAHALPVGGLQQKLGKKWEIALCFTCREPTSFTL